MTNKLIVTLSLTFGIALLLSKISRPPHSLASPQIITIEQACPTGLQALQSGIIYDVASQAARYHFCYGPGGNLTGQFDAISINGDVISTGAPQLTFSGFIAAPTSIGSFAFFFPQRNIIINRLTAFVGTSAVGCSPFPVWSVFDNSNSSILTSITDSTAQAVDSGVISVPVVAHQLHLRVTTAAAGCATPPANLNLTMTYMMQ